MLYIKLQLQKLHDFAYFSSWISVSSRENLEKKINKNYNVDESFIYTVRAVMPCLIPSALLPRGDLYFGVDTILINTPPQVGLPPKCAFSCSS